MADTGQIRANAERYYQAAKGAKFDYARLLQADRAELRRLVREAQRAFSRANPAHRPGRRPGWPLPRRV